MATTMKDRFTIDCSYCGFLTTEKTLAEALETARRLSLRHNKPNEKITIFDRLAQRGVCNTWDIDGRCIGYKELSPVKGEQAGMLGVPGKVHTQKQPWTPGQMEFESYGKLKAAKEQTTVPEEMKLLPNAKQNLYFWTVEQLREECIRQGIPIPKRYHKKELIDLLEPGMGLKPPYARKPGQVWDPEKHTWQVWDPEKHIWVDA